MQMKHTNNEISSGSTNNSSHPPQQFVEWSDALQYTCWCNSTIMASPQQVVQTLYPYHVQNVPTTTTTTTTPSVATTTYCYTTNSTMSPMSTRNDGDYDHQLHYIPWYIDKTNSNSNSEQEQEQISALLAIVRQRLATSSENTIPSTISGSKKLDDMLKNPNKNHNMNHCKNTMYSSIMSLWNQFVYNNNNSNDDDDGIDSTDYYNIAIMQQNSLTHPGYDIRNSMNMTNDDVDDYQNMIPKNSVRTPNPIATTTVTKSCLDDILNQMYISIDVMLDCIVYIQQQLLMRQRKFLLPSPNPKTINHQQDNDDYDDVVVTATATIVSVHSIRKEWFAIKNTFGDTNTSSATCTNDVSTSTALPLPNKTMNDDPNRVAQFVAETLSDQQFHWLLSILCQTPQQSYTTTTSTEEIEIDHQKYHDSYCLLQRIDRDVYSGGSVYVLQLPMMMIDDGTDHPSTSHEIRLTLYDLQQSKNTMQRNIEEWRSRIQEGAPPIISITNGVGTNHHNSIKQQRLKYLQRKRLYEQHIDNAESMLLNLESVELSILHTIHVSRPTISLLHQAKDVLQSLRCDSTNAILLNIENDIIPNDDLHNELELISSSLPYETLDDDENDNDGTASNVVVNEDDDIADLNVRLERLMSTTDTNVSINRVHDDNTSRTLEQGNALLV